MKNNKEKTSKTARNILLLVLAFLSLGAIGGGIVLIISPTGELMGMPLSEFKNIPFDSFMIPGIFLLVVLGIIPSMLIIALIKKPDSSLAESLNIFKDMHWTWSLCIYIAFILIAWIHIELIFMQGAVHWLQTFYMAYAVLILTLALLPGVRYLYKKHNNEEISV